MKAQVSSFPIGNQPSQVGRFGYGVAIFILCFLVPWCNLAAQTSIYHPFPDSNAVWGMGSGCTLDMSCNSSQYIQNYYSGDTIIDGMNYKIIHEATSAVSSPCCGVPSDLGAGYLRDDTAARKVYWRIPGMDTDTLLYDFTLDVGDTLGGLYGNTGLCAQGVYTVQSVDSVQVGNGYRRRINFSNIASNPCNSTSIIEGVGSTTGLTSCYATPASFGIILTCFMVNGELLYTKPCGAPELAPCGDLPLGISAIVRSGEPDVAAIPNPSTGLFHLAHSTAQISIYNAQGRLLFRHHDKEVDLSAYPPGVYTAVVQTAKGNSAQRLVVVR